MSNPYRNSDLNLYWKNICPHNYRKTCSNTDTSIHIYTDTSAGMSPILLFWHSWQYEPSWQTMALPERLYMISSVSVWLTYTLAHRHKTHANTHARTHTHSHTNMCTHTTNPPTRLDIMSWHTNTHRRMHRWIMFQQHTVLKHQHTTSSLCVVVILLNFISFWLLPDFNPTACILQVCYQSFTYNMYKLY